MCIHVDMYTCVDVQYTTQHSHTQKFMRARPAPSLLPRPKALDERFKTRHWVNPLPAQGRLFKFPHCARCFASFMLINGADA